MKSYNSCSKVAETSVNINGFGKAHVRPDAVFVIIVPPIEAERTYVLLTVVARYLLRPENKKRKNTPVKKA